MQPNLERDAVFRSEDDAVGWMRDRHLLWAVIRVPLLWWRDERVRDYHGIVQGILVSKDLAKESLRAFERPAPQTAVDRVLSTLLAKKEAILAPAAAPARSLTNIASSTVRLHVHRP